MSKAQPKMNTHTTTPAAAPAAKIFPGSGFFVSNVISIWFYIIIHPEKSSSIQVKNEEFSSS